MSQANVELARKGYELWNSGGVEAVRERFWTPDVVLYDLPEIPDGGIHHGADAVAARLRAIEELMGHFQQRICALEGSGDYTLATIEVTGEGQTSGTPVTVTQHHIMRWTDEHMDELRAYLDGDQARREYERLIDADS
jgi:ketosteroid isomerase-like protein